jgi:hypothetical protein
VHWSGSTLAADGARQWALKHSIPVATDQQLATHNISERARRVWHSHCARVQHHEAMCNAETAHDTTRTSESICTVEALNDTTGAVGTEQLLNDAVEAVGTEQLLNDTVGAVGTEQLLNDTVGAVCIDTAGNVASGVSSGGISLKTSGRVGDSALFGCGCFSSSPASSTSTSTDRATAWPDDWQQQHGVRSVGTSVSGTGEEITRSLLAFEAAVALAIPADSNVNRHYHSDLACSADNVDQEHLEDWELLRRVLHHYLAYHGPYRIRQFHAPHFANAAAAADKSAGIVALLLDPVSAELSIVWSHSTPSMAIAYQTNTCKCTVCRGVVVQVAVVRASANGGDAWCVVECIIPGICIT